MQPYCRKNNFCLSNLVNSVFVTLTNNEMTNSHAMPRVCMLVNDTITATLVSDQRCMCFAVTIAVSAGNLTENTYIVRFIYNMAYHSRRMLTKKALHTALQKVFR